MYFGETIDVNRGRKQRVCTSGGLVEVHVDALELEIGVAVVGTGGVYTVLIANDLPELGTDLVTALTTLNVNDFAHLLQSGRGRG
jgi:hypothetical protein